MDLFPGSDSDTDVSANPDYDGDLESAEATDSPSSDSDSEQLLHATGPSHVSQATVQREKQHPQKTKWQKQMSKAERQLLMTQVRQIDISHKP